MNSTALRPKVIGLLDPLATACIRLGISPNMVTFLSLFFGVLCACLYALGSFVIGSLMLLISAVLDLVDGSVARASGKESRFGAVIDWIVDKYVDGLALIGIGISGIPILSHLIPSSLVVLPVADFAIVAFAVFGSMMNTFIKPVVYAETGYSDRKDGKIDDPLEGIGFFGRPETIAVLILGGLSGFIWLSVIIVAVCTNLSALERIMYLSKRLS